MRTALTRYDATLHASASAWVSLPLDERRRQATAAAQTKDLATLGSLLEAFLATYSDASATISRHRPMTIIRTENWNTQKSALYCAMVYAVRRGRWGAG